MRQLLPISCLLCIAACASAPVVRQQCYDADAQLAAVLAPLWTLQAAGCAPSGLLDNRASECDLLKAEIARLSVICPGHAPTLMANAVIAYDDKKPAEAQGLLDVILSQPRPFPAAAVLRAQIAMEEGNIPFARRLLEQQIKLTPDHPGLHETYAAALYLDGKLPDSRNELTVASALGAPRWRVAYHLGLIEEASGRRDEASKLYAEALAGNPNWAVAESRLKALRAVPGGP